MAAVTSPTGLKVSGFFQHCVEGKHFLYRVIRLSMDPCFINLLLKSSWAEKLFDIVILQAEREKTADSSLSHLADLQMFSQGEIRNNASL